MHARCTWLQACLLVSVCVVSVLRLASAAEVERQVAVDFASRPTFLDSETIKLLPKELASSMIEMKAQVPTPVHSADPFQDHSLKLDSDGIPIPARQTVHFTKHVPASHARFRFRSAPTPVRNDDVSNTKSSQTSPRVKVHNSHPNHVAADGAVFQRGHYFDKARFRSIRSDEAPDFKAAYNEDDISHHAVDDQSEVTPLRRATAHVSAKEAEHRQTMHEQMMKHLSEETSGSEAGSSEESSSESAESSTSESSESAESAEPSSESPSESADGSESVGEPAPEPSMSNSMMQSSFAEHSSVVGGANYESQFSDEADEDYEVTPAQLAMDQQKMQQQQQSNPRFMQTNSLPYGGAPGNYDGHLPSMGLFPPRDGRDDPLTDGAGSRVRPGEGHFSGRGANAPRFRSSSSSRILQGIMYARQQRAAQRRMANGRAQFQDAQMNEPGNPDMSPMMMNSSPMMMQQRAFQPSAGMDDGGGMMMPGAPAGMDPRMMGGMASMTPMAPMANSGMMMQGQQPLPQFNLPPSLDDTQEPLMLEQESSIHVSNSENHRHHSTGGPITDRLGEMRFAQRFGIEADSGTSAFDGPAGSPGGGLSSLAPGPRSISRIRDPSIPDAPAMEPSPSALNNNAPRMTPGGLTEEIYTPPHVVL